MNGMRVLSVKSAVSENRVQYSFLSDRSLSNISISYIYIYINYIYLIIWTVCVFCQWGVLLVKTEFSVHFLLTGAYQTSLYPIYIYLIIWTVCVFCQWRVLLVKTEFSIHYLVTGACLNILTLMWMEIISLSYLYVEAYVIDVVCDSYIGILGSHKNIISTLPGS